MKVLIFKFGLPVGMGIILLIITIMGFASSTFVSCQKSCPAGQCLGNDGKCYGPCTGGAHCTKSASGNCSSAVSGVYCCIGGSSSGGGGSTTKYCNTGNTYNYSSQVCCPNGTPYYYPGTHGIKPAGCYASCPYVGDCGTKWTKY